MYAPKLLHRPVANSSPWFREGGIAVDEYIDAFVVERRRQQEVAERQRALDAQNAKAEADPEAANDDQDDDNFDLREVIQNHSGTFEPISF